VKQALRRLANNQKAALKQWIASLFDSAKDQAVNWGEDTLNQLLN
jgi:ribonucleotide reductase beta subunit family protein with ferritin-like domain